MATIKDVKQAIKDKLDALVTSNDLGSVMEDDFRVGLHDRIKKSSAGDYPLAILSVPAIDSEAVTSQQNNRTLTYVVSILMQASDITNEDDVEVLAETILNKFDNDPTLSGNAEGGLQPATSVAEAVTAIDRKFVTFDITLKASTRVNLDFS